MLEADKQPCLWICPRLSAPGGFTYQQQTVSNPAICPASVSLSPTRSAAPYVCVQSPAAPGLAGCVWLWHRGGSKTIPRPSLLDHSAY